VDERIKALLLVGGPWHDGPGMRDELRAALTANAPVDLTVTNDPATLTSPELAANDVVIIYTTGGELTEAQAHGLTDFVASGKGFVGLHGATTSFKTSSDYVKMIGSTFIRHPAFAEVRVKVVDPSHPITQGVTEFVVPDELYMLKCDPADFHLLATAELDGVVEPSAYVKSWGQGRVFYLGLGHDARCLGSEGFRRLAGQGLRWAARNGAALAERGSAAK